ncbi:MAG: hypothetical protein H0V25_00785, partial [Solirubrobacterales bacterium]|nr:hypothetical protein [Solirubrobacterales bacterium]
MRKIDRGGPRWAGSLVLAALVALALALSVFGGHAAGAPGDSDGSFSKDGVAGVSVSYFPPPLTGYNDLALQPDGKIVVVGTTGENSEAYSPEAVAARFNADGSLDASFGKKGTKLIEFPAPDDTVGAVSVAVAPDGRILIATAGENVDLARLNPDGSLDSTFSGDGEAQIPLPGFARLSIADLALSGDGRMVVGGTATAAAEGAKRDFLVARFAPDGTPDPSFSGDGFATSDLGGEDFVIEIALGPDGSVVAGGGTGAAFTTAASSVAVARYTPAGSLDPSFSGDGVATSDAGDYVTGVAIDGSGRVALSAAQLKRPIFTAARFTPAGELDPSFGSGGVAKLSFGDPSTANDLAVAADGSLTVVGFVNRSVPGLLEEDFAVGRLDAAGHPDPSFAQGGRRTTDLRCNGSEEARTVAIDAQGRIVAGGQCEFPVIPQAGLTSSALTVARYEVAPGPADEDADGIVDSKDRCPGAFERGGKGKTRGCPEV